jgi:hypothetical protein
MTAVVLIPFNAPEHDPLAVAADVLERWAREEAHREGGLRALSAAALIRALIGQSDLATA